MVQASRVSIHSCAKVDKLEEKVDYQPGRFSWKTESQGTNIENQVTVVNSKVDKIIELILQEKSCGSAKPKVLGKSMWMH